MDESVDRAAVFTVLPTPYVVLTPDLVVLDMNEAYLGATGRTREELVGQVFLEAFPPPPDSLDEHGVSELERSLVTVRETARPDTLPVQRYPIRGTDGQMEERHWLAVHVPVLDDTGAVRYLVQRTEDITDFARERERVDALAERIQDDADRQREWESQRTRVDLMHRARELADALAERDAAATRAAVLARVALDLAAAQSIEELDAIVVGRGLAVIGADGGIVERTDRGWRVRVRAGADVPSDPSFLPFLDMPYDSPLPGAYAARTGRRLVLPDRAAGLAFNPVMAVAYDQMDSEAIVVEPIRLGDEPLGALAALWPVPHEPTDGELQVVSALAAQCAQTMFRLRTEGERLEQAREVAQLATSLQAALLTPAPHPPHLDIAVAYRPAAHQAQVGGDWYDAFEQADGTVMLVIGDVSGHDSEAAARMGQLRGLLRALAYDPDPGRHAHQPAQILSRVERAARGLEVETLATAVVAAMESDDRSPAPPDGPGGGFSLRWTNAGHPPPVVLHPDGTATLLDVKPDVLLGVAPDRERVNHLTALQPGSAVLLYTDGLVERRGGWIEDGLVAVRAAVTGLRDRSARTVLDQVLQRLAPEAGEDDIALLVVRIEPGSTPAAPVPPRWDVELPHTTDAPGLARDVVERVVTGLPDRALADALLLTSELVGNAVRYGERPLGLTVETEPGRIRVAVHDAGPETPRLAADAPAASAGSGRGLLIVAALADRWGVTPDPDGPGKTVWWELSADGRAG